MADVTISDLGPLTPSTGLVLPVSNGSSTGKVTLSQVCGVMTSAQITTALGYTPYNGTTNPNQFISNTNTAVIKAWVNWSGLYDSTGAQNTLNTNRLIRSSYNVSSVLRISEGYWTITFPSGVFTNENYIILESCGGASNGRHFYLATTADTTGGSATDNPILKTTTQVRVRCGLTSDPPRDNNHCYLAFLGN